MLEVTITHNLSDAVEVKELFQRQWIALDWGRNGSDPNAYTGNARTHVNLFHTMRENGAAVIATYKKATTDNPSRRLVGLVATGVQFEYLNIHNAPDHGLLCLPLSKVTYVDASHGFFGNLPPRRCTVQQCSTRARGLLAKYANGIPLPRSVYALHYHDVEWLVTNYLMTKRMCTCVWSGGRSYEGIDHAGWMPDGRELLAQTTISADLVRDKATRLKSFASAGRELYFFGLKASESQCPEGVNYFPIETVFSELDNTDGGRWLINRMLPSLFSSTNVTSATEPEHLS